jgi:predicted amidophosphoribosyltransferase
MSKFKIKITTSQPVPQNIPNPFLEYQQDMNRKSSRLFVQVFYNNQEIGLGIVLDFYKCFEIIEDFGVIQTRVLNMNTHVGSMVYKLKYYRDPPLPEDQRRKYIETFTDIWSKYIEKIKEVDKNLGLTFIPSSRRIPDELANELGRRTGLETSPLIVVNPEMQNELKNIQDINSALELAGEKYFLDRAVLNLERSYVIIDDIMGYGSSLAVVLKKLHEITGKKNYFLVLAKDVKR